MLICGLYKIIKEFLLDFYEDYKLETINLIQWKVFVCFLIGGAIPCLFSSLTISAVGRAAYYIINEVRYQFANVKSTVTYPADLFQAVKWHDGSPLDASDFVMRMIMTFDPAKPQSAIYDASQVETLDAFLNVSKACASPPPTRW
jgi:ABC-type transport system substrate-binding protein